MRTITLAAFSLFVAAAALDAQETRFTPTLRVGQQLSLATVDGDVIVTRGEGRTAEIVATKRVRRGDGSRVKAVMEETSDGVRVCTVYLHKGEPDRNTCRSESSGNWSGDDNYDIELNYVVKLPAGVKLTVNTVDGDVDAQGIDAPASIRSVDGDIRYSGVAPSNLNTVDGDVHATITSSAWSADMVVQTVDGSIDISLPADVAVAVKGSTVDGSFSSDFPMTIREKWGPRSFEGTIGSGGTRSLRLSSVDGDVTLRRK
jgi:hypothetical protein